jgi:hypothetical protein
MAKQVFLRYAAMEVNATFRTLINLVCVNPFL